MKRYQLALLAIFSYGLVAVSCNQPETDVCQPAVPTSFGRIESDTVCLGLWLWETTYEYHYSNLTNSWILFDTIYPGDEVTGFETINYYSVLIDEKSICVTQDEGVNQGCYAKWESSLHSSQINSPPYNYVVSSYLWDASGGWTGRFNWGVHLIGNLALDYSPSGLPYNTSISGTPTYEEDTGIRYSSIFVRVD